MPNEEITRSAGKEDFRFPPFLSGFGESSFHALECNFREMEFRSEKWISQRFFSLSLAAPLARTVMSHGTRESRSKMSGDN